MPAETDLPLDDLSFADKVKKLMHVLGPDLTWEQYQEIIEKASESIIQP